MSPRLLRWGLNLWPPFRGAGIRVRHIAADWSEARVELREGLLNRNFVGTHYGGSLFSMTDPFYALMLMHRLGERYLVWDQAASIDFVAPGRGKVAARFFLAPETIKEIEAQAAAGQKVLPQFDVEVKDEAGALVGLVVRRLPQRDHAVEHVLFPGCAALRPRLAAVVDDQHGLAGAALCKQPALDWRPAIGVVLLQAAAERREVVDDHEVGVRDDVGIELLRRWVG